jgi:UPF0755 protein
MARGGPWCAALALTAIAGCAPATPTDLVLVGVPEGAPIEAVAESLAVHGVVPSATGFVRLARYDDDYRRIQPGVYRLPPGLGRYAALAALLKGDARVRVVVIRERMTLAEVADALAQSLRVPREDVLAAATDSTLRARLGAAGPTVEGYLFPTTYYVPFDASVPAVLRQMADTFEARWRPTWTARLDTLELSRDQVVILASIIAGEMPLDDERFLVASMYHNRLTRGMRLQADPTVVYTLGERRRLTYADYRVASDYNTYTINGLPPGPIGEPSSESIEAALYPATTDYLYMVAGPDGSHQFSRTYREHLRTVREIRRGGKGR